MLGNFSKSFILAAKVEVAALLPWERPSTLEVIAHG